MGSGVSISQVRELTAEELAGAATASGRDPVVAKLIVEHNIDGATVLELDDETIKELTDKRLEQKKCLGALHYAQQYALRKRR